MKHLTNISLYALIMFSTNGCAVNGVGSVAAKVTVADGARVVELYSFGGHLRTWEAEPGLTVGLSRRVYVYRCGSNTPECIPAGWHYFKVPHLSAAVARDVRSVGLDIAVARPVAAFTVGYQAMTVMAILPIGKTTTMRLRYISGKPEATQLEICEEDKRCGY